MVKLFEDGKIVDFWRAKYEYYSTYEISRNKGFESVCETGESFLCNDIPKDAAKENYYNPRLNNNKVRAYLKDIGNLDNHSAHERWIDCWVENMYKEGKETKRKPPTPESCYMSTLIIPMTLINNEGLSDKFREHFNIPRPSPDKNLGRAIYGFLCFDHREINYFHKVLDVKMGYIFADLLSLYLIEQLNYTEYSKTVQKKLKTGKIT